MIEAIGSRTLNFFASTAGVAELFWFSTKGFFLQVFRLRFRYRETLDQLYGIGVQSLPVIAFSLVFISLMMTIEFSYHMKLVLRQDTLVPAFSTLLVLREMGPVITAMLLASRVGAGIAAEVGTMRITDQVDALKLLGIDPIEFLVLPRWIGCVFATVSLTMVAIALSILGGAFISAAKLGQGVQEYFNSMFLFARYSDIIAALVKAAVFGTVIPFVSCYEGFQCQKGAEGVGRATTAAVVHSTVLILVLDFVLTYLLYAL